MSYRFHANEDLSAGLRRVIDDQVGKALAELRDEDLGVDERIHQFRKRCKKSRAALRLVRPGLDAYSEANARFRDLARRLSEARDAQSFLETIDSLRDNFDALPETAFGPLREGLLAHRERLTGPDSGIEARLAELGEELEAVAAEAATWQVEGERYAVIRGGLAKSYGRGREAMADAYETPAVERFHEWRKRAKYHRYHLRLLAEAWPELLDPLREILHELTDQLGDAHDLAVLRDHLVRSPADYGGQDRVKLIVGLSDQRRAELRARARGLGARIFAEPADAAATRFTAYLQAWDEDAVRPALARLDDPDAAAAAEDAA